MNLCLLNFFSLIRTKLNKSCLFFLVFDAIFLRSFPALAEPTPYEELSHLFAQHLNSPLLNSYLKQRGAPASILELGRCTPVLDLEALTPEKTKEFEKFLKTLDFSELTFVRSALFFGHSEPALGKSLDIFPNVLKLDQEVNSIQKEKTSAVQLAKQKTSFSTLLATSEMLWERVNQSPLSFNSNLAIHTFNWVRGRTYTVVFDIMYANGALATSGGLFKAMPLSKPFEELAPYLRRLVEWQNLISSPVQLHEGMEEFVGQLGDVMAALKRMKSSTVNNEVYSQAMDAINDAYALVDPAEPLKPSTMAQRYTDYMIARFKANNTLKTLPPNRSIGFRLPTHIDPLDYSF